MSDSQTQDFPPPAKQPDGLPTFGDFLALASLQGDGAALPSTDTPLSLPTEAKTQEKTRLAQQCFTLLRPHAQGGLGRVSVARDEKLKREIAFKEIRPDRLTPQVRQRFLTEAEITGQLEHPGIVPIYSLQEDVEGNPSYTMRFIQGRTLRTAINEYHAQPDPLVFRNLLQRFIAVCQTMAYAHSKGVIHRDLKPDNIMLGAYGETLVLDWGLAKRLTAPTQPSPVRSPTLATAPPSLGDSSLPPPLKGEVETTDLVPPGSPPQTEHGEILGTPAYMAPEQARGEIDQLGPAADIYALGVILYELLTNQLPYQGSIFTILHQLKEGTRPPLPALAHAVAKPLGAVCRKAMAPAIADRYATAAAFAQELERYLADEPVLAYAEPFHVRARRWLRRHRVFAASIVVGLAVAVPLLTAGLFAIDSFRRSETVAKDDALRAKDDALRAEDRAREIIFTMTSPSQLEVMGRQPQLTPAQEQLLRSLVVWYREYAGKTAATEAELLRQADVYLRLGRMLDLLGQRGEAVVATLHAAQTCERLVAANPSDPEFQGKRSFALGNLSLLQEANGQHAEAEVNCQEAVRLREKLAQEQPQVPAHRQELARLWHQFGILQEGLGHHAAAETAYVKAGQLLESLPTLLMETPSCQFLLAQVWNSRGHQQMKLGRMPTAEAGFHKARSFLEKLAAADPGYHAYQARLADVWTNLGCLQASSSRVKEAQASFLKALELRQKLVAAHPSMASFQSHLAAVWKFLGAIQNITGQQKEAEASCQEARQILERLLAADPNVLTYAVHLAEVWYNLGLVQFNTGRFPEAETSWRQSLRLREKLAASYPHVPDHLYAMMSMHNALGTMQHRIGQLPEAEASTDQARQIGEKLMTRFPQVPSYQAALVHTCNNLGLIQTERKRMTEAQASFAQARQIGEQLVTRYPQAPSHQLLLVNTWHKLGSFQQDNHQWEEAEASYRQSCQIGEKLLSARPHVTAYQVDLAGVTCDLASLLFAQKRLEEALTTYERATTLIEDVLRREPKHPDAQRNLHNSCCGRGRTLEGLGQPALAAVAWDKALASARPERQALARKHRQQALTKALAAARLQARSGLHAAAARTVELLHSLPELAGADRWQMVHILADCLASSGGLFFPAPTPAECDQYAKRAVAQLRRLQATGFFQETPNLELLQSTPDLAALRQHPAFAAFMKELRK
jgi:serine/threonine-protein kinase